LLSRFAINQSNRIFDGYEGLIPLWEESLSSASDKTVDLAAESILLYTFSRLSVHSSERDGIVRKIVEMSEENFRDQDLSISEIAKTLAYNPKYASHIFKKKMGVSFSEYLRSVRIKFAVSLFDHGLDSVKNVALLSGFYDPLYFSTVFKSVVGLSPKDYAKKVLEQKELPV
jgi:two-component system response regulator YesN